MGAQDSDGGARAHRFLSSRGAFKCVSVWPIFIPIALSQAASLVGAFIPDLGFYF